MAVTICDLAGCARGTWQLVFDMDQPGLWVQWIPKAPAPYVPDCFTIDEFFESPRINRLQNWARESLSILLVTAIFTRWKHNQTGPNFQKTPPILG